MIYFDNASTTRPSRAAVAAVNAVLTENFGNPSSLHELGTNAARTLRESRASVAASIKAETREIYFTSGGTEADNWAIFSGARSGRGVGRHIVTTAVEHDAVLKTVKSLVTKGFELTVVEPDEKGRISAESVLAALRPDTALVSVMLVNNETGAVMPVAEIAAGIKALKHPALLHTDAVQGLFKVPVSVKKLGVDMLSLSAHKIHGVKGAGALYIRSGLHLAPFVYGGGQEGGERSGTEAMPAIAAFGAACAEGSVMTGELKEYALARLSEAAEPFGAMEAPHVIPLFIKGVPSQVMVSALSDEGFAVSAGSACSKGGRSHVLTAMRLSGEYIDNAIRVSLCEDNTREEIDALAAAIKRVSERVGGKRHG